MCVAVQCHPFHEYKKSGHYFLTNTRIKTLFLNLTNSDPDIRIWAQKLGPRFELLHYFAFKVYHSFHDEVKLYKTHWWKCDGPCQHRAPYFGLVKRSMNRAPGPNDIWWNDHRATCNGQFHKIREPENYRQKKSKEKTVEVEKKNGNCLNLCWLVA